MKGLFQERVASPINNAQTVMPRLAVIDLFLPFSLYDPRGPSLPLTFSAVLDYRFLGQQLQQEAPSITRWLVEEAGSAFSLK